MHSMLASVVTWLVGASWWPAGSLAAALVLAGAGLSLAWTAGGWKFVGLADLARLPLYLAWKIPLYFGLLRDGAPEEWKRTDRSAAPHPGDR